MHRIEITDRIRVPKKALPLDLIKDRYNVDLFDDNLCNRCENLPDRSPNNELCSGCKSFGGSYQFFSSKELKENKVYALPQGDEFAIRRALDKLNVKYKWVDKRSIHDMKVKNKIKFTGKLYTQFDKDDWGNPRPDQKEALKKWWKTKVGVICAPARSGKTIMATAAYTYVGVRTVVIAAKKELLNQFYETACGVPAPKYLRGKFVASEHDAGRKGVTNIPQLQKKTGRQIIFKPKSYKELITYIKKHKEIPDVLLITYQSFARDLKRVQRIINKYYSLAIIDEEHGAGADKYLAFVSSLNLKYRLGLSATPDRKDMRSDLTKLVYGGVVSRIRTTTLRPHMKLKHSEAVPTTVHTTWRGAYAWIIHNKKRNVEIVREVFKDLRAGHNSIIIPVDYRRHVDQLVKMINHQAKISSRKKDEDWPKVLARPFHAALKDRLETLIWADEDDGHKVHKKLPTRSPRVLVAIRSMIKEGVDLKRPSKIHIVMPMSAKKGVGAPAFQQLSMRVATPFVGKPEPECTIWLDNVRMFSSCVSGLLFNEILPRTALGKAKHPQYQLSKEDYETFKRKIAFVQANMTSSPVKKSTKKTGYW